VMVENVRTGFVWDTFMKNEEARRGMERAGFTSSRSPTATQPAGPALAPGLQLGPVE